MKTICLQCEGEFEAERGTARFCSPSCRVKFNRISVTEEPVSVTKVSVTNTIEGENVTVTDDSVTDVMDNLPVIEVTDKELMYHEQMQEIYEIIREKLMQFPLEERDEIWKRLKEGKPLNENK
jgi:hypothetical protein